jgi:hypothetical protein
MQNEQIIKDTEFYTQYINAIGQETYFDKIEQKHFSKAAYFAYMFGEEFMDIAEETDNNIKWKA